MVVTDNTFLSLLLHPRAKPPTDPTTGRPIERLYDRIELLIEDLQQDSETVAIPAPALSEFLLFADVDGPRYLSEIDADPLFEVKSFDQKAAVELAAINREARSKRSKRSNKRDDADVAVTKAKLNFDRQIVAIAKANEATVIYSDDEDVEKIAKQAGIQVVKTWELPLPQAKQIDLPGVEVKKLKTRKIAFEEDEI